MVFTPGSACTTLMTSSSPKAVGMVLSSSTTRLSIPICTSFTFSRLLAVTVTSSKVCILSSSSMSSLPSSYTMSRRWVSITPIPVISMSTSPCGTFSTNLPSASLTAALQVGFRTTMFTPMTGSPVLKLVMTPVSSTIFLSDLFSGFPTT